MKEVVYSMSLANKLQLHLMGKEREGSIYGIVHQIRR